MIGQVDGRQSIDEYLKGRLTRDIGDEFGIEGMQTFDDAYLVGLQLECIAAELTFAGLEIEGRQFNLLTRQ